MYCFVHTHTADTNISERNHVLGELTDCLTWLHIQEFIPHLLAVHPCHRWPILALILSISYQVSNTLSEMSNDTSQYSSESENGRMDKDMTLLPQ